MTQADKFVPLKYAPCGVILNARMITGLEYTGEKITDNVKKIWTHPEYSATGIVQAFIDWIAGRESENNELHDPVPYYEVFTPGEWIKMTHKELEETFRPAINYKLVLSVQPDKDNPHYVYKSWDVYDAASLVIGTADGAKFYLWGDEAQILRVRTNIVDMISDGSAGVLDLDNIQSNIMKNSY